MKGEQDGPGPRRPGPDGPHDNRGPNSDRPPGFGPQQKQHKNDLPLADQVYCIFQAKVKLALSEIGRVKERG